MLMLVLGVILGVVLVIAFRRDQPKRKEPRELGYLDYPEDMREEYLRTHYPYWNP